MYCVYDERSIVWSSDSHARQFREDREGNRCPMAEEPRATIRIEDGLFYGIINGDETIAISDDIDEVAKRLKRVDKNIEFTVYDAERRRRFKSIEDYHISKLSTTIYRMSYSEAAEHGLIIAIDRFRAGEHSKVRLFYDFDDVIKYIKRGQGSDGDFILYGRRPSGEFDKEVGGLDYLDISDELRTTKPLQKAVSARKKAGSHEEYIKKVRQAASKKSQETSRAVYFDGDADYEFDDYDEDYEFDEGYDDGDGDDRDYSDESTWEVMSMTASD